MTLPIKVVIQRIADFLHTTGFQDTLLLPLILFLSRGSTDIPAYDWRIWTYNFDFSELKQKITIDLEKVFSKDGSNISSQLINTLEYLNRLQFSELINVLAYSQDELQRITPDDFLAAVVKPSSSPTMVEHFIQSPTADQISRLINEELGQYPSMKSVLELGAGSGVLTRSLQQTTSGENWHYTLIDKNRQIALIGEMHLLLSGIPTHQFDYIVDDALTKDWHRSDPFNLFAPRPIFHQDNRQEFDVILSHPPLGYDTVRNRVGLLGADRLEVQFIKKALDLLKLGGFAIIIVPDSFLTQQEPRSLDLRKFLVRNGLVRRVVSLPTKAIIGAGIRLSILIIEQKVNHDPQFIRFERLISSNDFFARQSDLFSIEESAQLHKIDTSVEEVIYNGYGLSARRYLLTKPVDSYRYIPLQDCAEIILPRPLRSPKTEKPTGSPLVTGTLLARSVETFQISKTSIELYVNENMDFDRMIHRGDVLVSRLGTKLRASLYNLNEPALAGNGILIIRPDRNRILPEYLVAQLWSTYTQQQLNAFFNGTTLHRYDLEQIQIQLPALDQQTEQSKDFFFSTLEKIQVDYKTSLQDEVLTTASRLQHSLGTSLTSIRLDLQALQQYFEQKGFDPITKPSPRPEVAEISRLSTVLNRLLTTTAHATRSITLSRDWVKVKQGIINSKFQPIRRFLINQSKLSTWSQDCLIEIIGEEVEMTFDADLMKILIDNFLDNAVRHGGFRGRQRTDNKIQIEVSTMVVDDEADSPSTTPTETQRSVFLYIRNNGNPLPNNFTIEKFTADGSRVAGRGWGGEMIGDIIRAHNGTLSAIALESTEFSVQFSIEFPIQ